MLFRRHRGPLIADFQRFYGLRLVRIRESGFTLSEVADFAANLPPDGAVARAVNPEEWQHTADTYLLREIEYSLRVLRWQQTADGQSRNPQNTPVRVALTAEELAAQTPDHEKFDASSIEEMDEFLGWNQSDPPN